MQLASTRVSAKAVVLTLALSAAFTFFSNAAYAQQAGDLIVSAGVSHEYMHASLGPLTSTGSNAAEAAGINAINNTLGTTTADVQNVSPLKLTVLKMINDNLGIEAVVGIPPKVNLGLNIPGAGPAYHNAVPTSYPQGASAVAWTPSLLAKYFFNSANDSIRPYLGVGINYTWFTRVEVENAALLQGFAGDGAKLSSSWNPVAIAGAVYNVDKKWSIGASLSYLPLKTTASFVSGSGATTTSGNLDLKPAVLTVYAGMKF
ncbi:MAG: OmpW family protein [Burkholderiales bacterium]